MTQANTEPRPVAYIVDDHEMNRDLLESVMRSVSIASEVYESAQAFLDVFEPARPGCLLLDIRMPGMNGLELLRVLKEREVVLPVVMVTAHGDVPVAIQAMKDGAFEFIEKPINNDHVVATVRRAFTASVERLRVAGELNSIRENHQRLSKRELEVMEAMVEGRLNKQIAYDLDISQRTVEVHRAKVMEKMQAGSLAELVRMAIRLRDGAQHQGTTDGIAP